MFHCNFGLNAKSYLNLIISFSYVGREGSEGQGNTEEERERGSGTGKGTIARESCTWTFVQGPQSP